ncbi:MAG: HNH endonuclease [Nitrospinae bacterium]|nr:HNH endonuclease [Nitrospinota bacterium]
MTTRPTAELRRRVVERADNCCEYCLLQQDLAASTHQVDHVIAEKHGGQTSLDNLALSCTVCNRRKGSDISSINHETGNLVSLFNPRTQQWPDHFRLDGVHIVGLTEIGRATVEFLRLNAYERLTERDALMRAGRYPPQGTAR